MRGSYRSIAAPSPHQYVGILIAVIHACLFSMQLHSVTMATCQVSNVHDHSWCIQCWTIATGQCTCSTSSNAQWNVCMHAWGCALQYMTQKKAGFNYFELGIEVGMHFITPRDKVLVINYLPSDTQFNNHSAHNMCGSNQCIYPTIWTTKSA